MYVKTMPSHSQYSSADKILGCRHRAADERDFIGLYQGCPTGGQKPPRSCPATASPAAARVSRLPLPPPAFTYFPATGCGLSSLQRPTDSTAHARRGLRCPYCSRGWRGEGEGLQSLPKGLARCAAPSCSFVRPGLSNLCQSGENEAKSGKTIVSTANIPHLHC